MASYLNLKPVDFDKLSAKRQALVKWEGRILLPKYDGCLALVFFQDGHGTLIMSRDGKQVKSMDHIFEDILVRYPDIAKTKGGWCLIGEAWIPGKAFSDLSGIFRRQRPQPELGFAVFDIVKWNATALGSAPHLHSEHPYKDRLALLEAGARRNVMCNVFPPLAVVCEGRDHADRYARYLKGLGSYDGAIASDPDAPYIVSDGYGEFLKIKPLLSYTLEVVDVEPGIGEKTGRWTCALVVRFKDRTCKVGTGFNTDEAERWALGKDTIIGKLIEVQCMDVYPGEQGLMREPRFVGFRDDVTNPDY